MASTSSILKLIRSFGFRATSAPKNSTPREFFTVQGKVEDGKVFVNLGDLRHLSQFGSYRDWLRHGREAEIRWTERFCTAGYAISQPVSTFLGADNRWHVQYTVGGLEVR